LPQVDFYDSLEHYYNAYKPEELVNREKYKRRKQYIQMGVILFSIIIIIYVNGV
ncbi:unnamed protein product, partial [marine sediment metagenome]